MKTLTIRLPEDVHSKFRIVCFENSTTMQNLLIEKIAELVKTANIQTVKPSSIKAIKRPKSKAAAVAAAPADAAPKLDHSICIHRRYLACAECGHSPFDDAHSSPI